MNRLSDGVKKIYLAQLMSIVLMAVTIFMALISIMALKAESNGLLALAGVLAIVILVLAIVIIVFEMLGCYRAGSSENAFMIAFYILVFTLAVSLVGGFVSNTVVSVIISILGDACNILTTFFILTGLCNIFAARGNTEMTTKGKNLIILEIVLYVVALILNVVDRFLNNESTQMVAYIVSILAAVASLVAYILLFIYLKKSSELLESEASAPQAEPTYQTTYVAPTFEEPKEEQQVEEPKEDDNKLE